MGGDRGGPINEALAIFEPLPALPTPWNDFLR
jgi:hypothetical protein